MCKTCCHIHDRRYTEPAEPDPVYTCKYCGEGIFEDDEYAEIDGNYYHADCLSNEMGIYELLSLFGVDVKKAVADIW